MEPTTGLLILALFAMLLDLVSGIAKGAKNHELSSAKMREGAWHKSGFVGLLALAELLQIATQYADFGFEVPAFGAVCVFIIATEAVSIYENLCALNPSIADSAFGKLLASNTDGE